MEAKSGLTSNDKLQVVGRKDHRGNGYDSDTDMKE